MRASTAVSATRPARPRQGESLGDVRDLLNCHDRRDIEWDVVARETADDRPGKNTLGVHYGNLDVDVRHRGRYDARLPLHHIKIIGKDFEGNRKFGDLCEHAPREGLVIGRPGLSVSAQI